MIVIHNETTQGEYFSKLTEANAAVAIERLSDIGLRAWLKCLAGHSKEFEWKHPTLTEEETQELADQGFLIPMGYDAEDWEFDAMGGYGAAPIQTVSAQNTHTGYNQPFRSREAEQRRKEAIDKEKIHFSVDGDRLIVEYEGHYCEAEKENGEAFFQPNDNPYCTHYSTGYTWKEALAIAKKANAPDSCSLTYGDEESDELDEAPF